MLWSKSIATPSIAASHIMKLTQFKNKTPPTSVEREWKGEMKAAICVDGWTSTRWKMQRYGRVGSCEEQPHGHKPTQLPCRWRCGQTALSSVKQKMIFIQVRWKERRRKKRKVLHYIEFNLLSSPEIGEMRSDGAMTRTLYVHVGRWLANVWSQTAVSVAKSGHLKAINFLKIMFHFAILFFASAEFQYSRICFM